MVSNDQKAECILDQLKHFLEERNWEIYGESTYLTKKGIKLNVQIREKR